MSEPLVPKLGRASSGLQLATFLLDSCHDTYQGMRLYDIQIYMYCLHIMSTIYKSTCVDGANSLMHMFGKWGLDRRRQAKIGPLRFLMGRIKTSHTCRRDVLLFCRLTTCNWHVETFWLNCNASSATPRTFFPFSFPGTALFALRGRSVRIFGTHRPGKVRCGLETMVKPSNQYLLQRYMQDARLVVSAN